MHMSTLSIVSETVFWPRRDLPWRPSLLNIAALVLGLTCLMGAANAQTFYEPTPGDSPYIVEGSSD